eukprot:6179986-Pleurochrysis_carterae.AAC.1
MEDRRTPASAFCERRAARHWADNAVLFNGDVHVQQVRDGSLILHIPSRGQVRSEIIVQGTWAIVRVQCKKVIVIATENETLVDSVDGARECEYARVGRTLRESPFKQPRK